MRSARYTRSVLIGVLALSLSMVDPAVAADHRDSLIDEAVTKGISKAASETELPSFPSHRRTAYVLLSGYSVGMNMSLAFLRSDRMAEFAKKAENVLVTETIKCNTFAPCEIEWLRYLERTADHANSAWSFLVGHYSDEKESLVFRDPPQAVFAREKHASAVEAKRTTERAQEVLRRMIEKR